MNARRSTSGVFALGRSGTRPAAFNGETAFRKLNPRTKRTCLCSPTTHPGSFRCSFHKQGLRHTAWRMGNSAVRVDGSQSRELVRRALSATIRPSSHQLRRKCAFQPRPSRLSVMVAAGR
ncbi:uncharacterized protein LOC116250404 [Nymphaea colorata]|uniref:uncharacterized protein LOC116250404 n=1 Tax=Nymphaea colorata TaxID=210225 RepID=UPI00129E1DD2|nr:uncharacterized protein LOC116250404 [Nymphaea colorata]